jgi:hypothetical protein
MGGNGDFHVEPSTKKGKYYIFSHIQNLDIKYNNNHKYEYKRGTVFGE